MLQIKNISKKYITGEYVTMALDDVSLNLRDNEFVAILGPSGSGKTTLLNVIGGLDRYDEGDLIINGISTKDYTDRDWDSYRNHTIGFVFQSYNLIPHQSVLANVELALTISGVSREERRQRAIEALEQVGLGDQIHKRPNQMSGGQMQRVAIARALINNPDIVLADEPTGALDTETSTQVMALLKEVAKDRMVVMVTHNPDLAEEYATRIVRLQDGKITDDTDPLIVDEGTMEPPTYQNMGHSSMTMMTSVGLSLNNLITKRGRTLLTCFAGAIGIIAIGLILAVSSGVNSYIDSLEEDTMAEYPVEVTASGFDISGMMETMMGTVEQITEAETGEDGFGVMTMISRMVNVITTNELGPFKEYLESGETDIDEYAKAVEYIYDVEPQIYLEDGDEYHQVNPESTLTSGFGLGEALSSMMSSMMTMLNTFYQMPENEDLYIDSYEVMAGRWPEDYNECVLVIGSTGTVADYMLYTLGLEDFDEYEDLIAEAMNGGEIPEVEYKDLYTYDEVVGTTYKLVNAPDYYEYDSEYDVWTDKRDNESSMRQLIRDGEDITIVGVVRPLEDATAAILSDGINYPASLIEHVAEVASESEVVKDQLAHPDVNVLTGEEFGEDFAFDLMEMLGLDTDTLNGMFDMGAIMDQVDFSDLDLDLDSLDFSEMLDLDGMTVDLSGLEMDLDMDMSSLDMDLDMDMSNVDLEVGDLSGDFSQMFANMDMSGLFSIDSEGLTQITNSLMQGYTAYATANNLSTYEDLENDFANFLGTNSATRIFNEMIEDMIREVGDEINANDVMRILMGTGSNEEKMDELIDLVISDIDTQSISESLSGMMVEAYESYAASNGTTSAGAVSTGFNDYLATDSARQLLSAGMMSMMNQDALQQMVTAMMQEYSNQIMAAVGDTISQQMSAQLTSAMGNMTQEIQDQITAAMSDAMAGMMDGLQDQLMEQMESAMDMSAMTDELSDSIGDSLSDALSGVSNEELVDAIGIDEESFLDALDIDMDEDSLLELMTSMSSAVGSSYEGVLSDLGYVDYDNPAEIDIYPKDFDSKDGITAIIDDYNRMVDDAGEEEKEITYTDLMGTMMSTVSTIINIVTYVLIAFVAISLVVSSIMIGIITYISVLERTREIGILRAIGASKRNIGRIFNAETFLVGLVAGILGVVIALLLLIPINAIVYRFVQDESIRAFLPWYYGVILIVLSIVLTLIGGIIPSRKASKMDPVAALRSE